MKISILTICPELFDSFAASHVIRRAKELGQLELNIVDIRSYAKGSYRQIDDSPFGGGNGLILRCGPVLDALAAVLQETDANANRTYVAALTPSGVPYSQGTAESLMAVDHLVLICGHYEGMDERIYSHVDGLISIGDYVLTGGELPAMVVADSVARLLPGNLKKGSAEEESFSVLNREDGSQLRLLEYPQYTQPADFRGEKVPEVLLSGNHEAIRAYRQAEALRITKERRPDLLRDSD
ncbi:MAG: tRNA (guanosine(37)-N1)-methyltransferase TrmD [Lachnospiraceae bacterium]|nr:tRNA (guanosine(37)-N1)-methyltransferase TrmD [Lachnospiraceae bacterium]